jgi:CRP-like cAMP-binding protein
MSADRHPLRTMLKNLELRAALPDADRQAILALPHTVKMLEAGTYTLREAEPIERCGVLVSGFAYRQKLTGEGARQIIGLHIAGDAVDLQHLFLDVADHSIQMLTRGEMAFVALAPFQELVRSRPAIGHAVLVKILVEASIFREWVLNVGRRDARARTVHLLCELAIRLDREGLTDQYGYELPMTQEQLGDALGLTSVHVNRTLRSLEADGMLKRAKRSISFPDWDKLRSEGDFNQRYLHLEMQRGSAQRT